MRTGAGPIERVGILGGGQLARMLAEAADAQGLEAWVYVDEATAPAAQVAPRHRVGAASDAAALAAFLGELGAGTTVAIESEFFDFEAVGRALADLGSRAPRIAPGLPAVLGLRSKLDQKRRLDRLGIPTSPWRELAPGEAPPAQGVLKWARGGYDGKGVRLLGEGRPETAAAEFVRAAPPGGVYVEDRIPFRRELALLGARSARDGATVFWPLVETRQRDGICHQVLGPFSLLSPEDSAPREARARAWLARLMEDLAWEGVLAMELFETADGGLLVNEIAPRVHNSGHWTQDACATSQFENHWRALLGRPLGSTDSAPAFVMQNYVSDRAGPAVAPGPALLGPRDRLHFYGKAGARPGRKLGHVNFSGATPDVTALRDEARRLGENEEKWRSGRS